MSVYKSITLVTIHARENDNARQFTFYLIAMMLLYEI